MVIGGRGEDVAALSAAASALELRVVRCPAQSAGEVLEALHPTSRRSAFAGVMAAERAAVPVAWQVSEALGLPRLRNPIGVQLAGSRLATLARLASAGVRVPSWRTVASPDDIPDRAASGHAWEWALKLDTPRSAPVVLPTRRMRAAQAYALAASHGPPVYAQRWLPGTHLCAVGALVGGRLTTLTVLSRAFLGATPYQITCGFDRIQHPRLPEIAGLVESVARACRWTLGPIVVDLVESAHSGALAVVDAHPTVGEGGVPQLVGVDALRATLSAVCGQPSQGPVIIQPSEPMSLRYVMTVDGDAGQLVRQFEDRPRRMPAGVVRAVRPGDRIGEGLSRSEVWGWAIAAGESAAEILAAECYASVELMAPPKGAPGSEADADVDG